MRYLLLLIALATPAFAQGPNCAPLDAQLTHLRDNFGETIRVQGLAASGAVMLITASPAGGWTLLAVTPDNTACVLAAGEAFSAHDAEAQGEDS
jgi:hypothetical protein